MQCVVRSPWLWTGVHVQCVTADVAWAGLEGRWAVTHAMCNEVYVALDGGYTCNV